MKKLWIAYYIDLFYWFIVFVCLVFILASCKTTRETQKQEFKEEVKQENKVETKASAQAETKTETNIASETQIEEDCDTNVTIYAVIDGVQADPVVVPIKIHRTIRNKQFTNQTEQKKEEGTLQQSQTSRLEKETASASSDRKVERTRFPGWLVIVIIVAIAGIVFLIWRRKPP